MKRRELWAWISNTDGIHYEKIKKLLKYFKTPERIYTADVKSLVDNGGISEDSALKIIKSRESFNSRKFFENLDRMKIEFVCIDDKRYPQKLRPYSHKPYYLFYKGKLPDSHKKSVAMVGARACSDYGRKMSEKIACQLSRNGVQIISGMARGIDTYSQLGALTGKTPTYAVLGCGVDICYPNENIELYRDICRNGGIISEYAPGTQPAAWHFPQRNRIISGLSDIVTVVEAREKSGSLITVEWALEQGKDIMAVPGRIGEGLSSGCNRLIKAGAGIITTAEDVLEELFGDLKYVVFSEEGNTKIKEKALEKDLTMLYSELGLQPKSIYELIEATGLDYSVLTEKLLQLQLIGLVEQPRENYYSKID